MPIMINRGKEMLRISPKDSKKIEYSANQGRSWIVRYSGSSNTGAFSDLMDAGKEILGTTDKGLFYSTNDGRSWICRKRGISNGRSKCSKSTKLKWIGKKFPRTVTLYGHQPCWISSESALTGRYFPIPGVKPSSRKKPRNSSRFIGIGRCYQETVTSI